MSAPVHEHCRFTFGMGAALGGLLLELPGGRVWSNCLLTFPCFWPQVFDSFAPPNSFHSALRLRCITAKGLNREHAQDSPVYSADRCLHCCAARHHAASSLIHHHVGHALLLHPQPDLGDHLLLLLRRQLPEPAVVGRSGIEEAPCNRLLRPARALRIPHRPTEEPTPLPHDQIMSAAPSQATKLQPPLTRTPICRRCHP
jgi:hypothetical protein